MKKLLALLAFFSLLSCSDDVLPDESPSLELVSIGPSQVVELQDSIHIVVRYEDGDGDLGENSPDAKNLYLRDERIDLVYQYRIKELVPNGAEVAISGTLVLELPNTVITNGSSSEQVTYTIWVKDRAGHESNRITAGPLTVVSP